MLLMGLLLLMLLHNLLLVGVVMMMVMVPPCAVYREVLERLQADCLSAVLVAQRARHPQEVVADRW